MLYKLLLLTFLFLVFIPHISAEEDGGLTAVDPVDDTNTVDDPLDDPLDDTEATDELGTEVDNTDEPDDAEDPEVTDVDDNAQVTDSLDDGEDTEEIETTASSGESNDDNSSNDDDSDTSVEDSQSTDADNSQSGDDSEEEDECKGLSGDQRACADAEDSDGDQDCGYNKETMECYSVERRAGTHGSGNFDDGYYAAQQKAADDAKQLETLVGALGVVVGVLALAIFGGAYFMWHKQHKSDGDVHLSSMEVVDCEAPIITQRS